MKIDNFFLPEQDILTRLRVGLSGDVLGESIFAIDDMDTANPVSTTVITPAVYVAYAGFEAGESAGKGRRQKVNQRWLVVLVIANSGMLSTLKVRDKAGPLLLKIMGLLGGWSPDTTKYNPFEQESPPLPTYTGSYSEFPLVFKTEIVV